MAAATVAWTRAEIDEALGAVVASRAVRGKKKAVETLTKAQLQVQEKKNPKARVTIRFGEKPAAHVAAALRRRSSPEARSALRRLEDAALRAVRSARRSKQHETSLSNIKADTRDRRAQHVTGRPRPTR